MAVILTKLATTYTVKVENQDVARRNLVTEYHDIAWDGTETSASLPTKLKVVLEMNYFQIGGTTGAIALATNLAVASGAVIVSASAAPANTIKHRVVLTGLSY